MQQTIKGGLELAKSIKHRRNELNLTIEEAALKAGVGSKTWSRYEAGDSIRKDKYRGVCKALNWHSLPLDEGTESDDSFDLEEYKKHKAWSPYLMETFGILPAISFAVGSDILMDHLYEDMQALSAKPRGTHIGELGSSWLEPILPRQFLMRYDYEFLYALHTTNALFRLQAPEGVRIIANSVLEELVLYLIVEEARIIMEDIEIDMEVDSESANDDSEDDEQYFNEHWDEWIFDVFDDSDIEMFLYSNYYLTDKDQYHFDHWLDKVFYMDEGKIPDIFREYCDNTKEE